MGDETTGAIMTKKLGSINKLKIKSFRNVKIKF